MIIKAARELEMMVVPEGGSLLYMDPSSVHRITRQTSDPRGSDFGMPAADRHDHQRFPATCEMSECGGDYYDALPSCALLRRLPSLGELAAQASDLLFATTAANKYVTAALCLLGLRASCHLLVEKNGLAAVA